jgi:NADPH-dependent curcumin reductase CurA
MISKINREIHLRSRPEGLPTADNFELMEGPLPEPSEGEVLVRNIYMSVDPYMRGRMREGKSYASPYQIGRVLYGGAVGEVVDSRSPLLSEGDFVYSNMGWREYFVTPAAKLTQIDPNEAPIQAFLGALGMPGLTAYVGLLDLGLPMEGETVFVSAAAGAVGSMVCQMAKIKGCRVVGSAGSAEKVAWLMEEAGIDAALNYKEVAHLNGELRRLAPEGIDIYFENVGGEHLEAALSRMNDFGRVVMCGLIALYNATEPPLGPSNLALVITKRLSIRGFIVSDHQDRLPNFYYDMGQWIGDGRIKWRETIVEGLENAPLALIGLFSGDNIGKMVVQIGTDPLA